MSDMAATKETGRLEAFSDGVFAIAITLLVLLIPVPHTLSPGQSLRQAVLERWPDFVAYGVSFLTILVMWINHHSVFSFIVAIDRLFLVLNGLLLLCVTFINYPTALVASFPGEQFAAGIYSGTMVLIAVLYNVLWRYATRGGRLTRRPASDPPIVAITRQYRYGTPLYAAALALAVVSGWGSLGICAALALYFAFTGNIGQRSRAAGEGERA